ncbi:lysylphosphatidylglycerol synthase transmembrane domain-containing protein [Comamonas serinivorans]|uniref:lysylphosphatidylglycerol synthase transmembrane domain-containing protein n=1 Tax=Comamonas serinivorans TaxID=1082851 RepID=UPI001F2DB1AF|nr:lysylphosphatidylglycerol synthase transmembrane domain-containing protein [Comamonas serinivorans]
MTRAGKTALRALLGLALLAALLMLAKPQTLWSALRGADGRWLLAGLAVAVASNVVSAWRWRLLVRFFQADLQPGQALRWYFQAIGLNALLPGAVVGGDVFRAVMLRRAGQPVAASTASVLLDRISGLWMLCGLGALGAVVCAPQLAQAMSGWLGLPVSPALLATVAVVVALGWLALPWGLPWLAHRLPQRLGPVTAAREAVVALTARPDYTRQLAWQVLASALVQVLSAAALACAGLALGVSLSWPVWGFAMAPIFLMAALPVSVGGWGTREAACVATLAPFGVAAPLAIGIGLVYGAYGLAQGALGALAFGLPGAAERR